MPLYTGIGGARKEITAVHCGIGGVKRELSELWAGVDGVKRKILPSGIQLTVIGEGVFYEPASDSYYTAAQITRVSTGEIIKGAKTLTLNPGETLEFIAFGTISEGFQFGEIYHNGSSVGERGFPDKTYRLSVSKSITVKLGINNPGGMYKRPGRIEITDN